MPTLTDAKIRTLAPNGKTQRHFDGAGLYLEISPSGGRYWRIKYRVLRREKRLSLGIYPTITLKEARERAHEARKLLSKGVDPSVERQAVKDSGRDARANSLEAIAREWHRTIHTPAVSEGQAKRTIGRLEKDIFPWLGSVPIEDLDAPALLKAVRRVESRGAVETARRELQSIGQVVRYAIATGRATRDPTSDLRGALTPVVSQHMASLTDPDSVAGLMRAIDGYEGLFHVRCALKLVLLTFVRPGELRSAAWAEFELEEATWRIPSARMKGSKSEKQNGPDHLVPLSKQAVAILRELHPLTSHRAHLFPSTRGEGRAMSDMTLTSAIRRMGYSKEEMCAHGFRATARTLMVERLGIDESVVEAQLAHRVKDALGRAYNRTTFVEQRRIAMQLWADYLDQLRSVSTKAPTEK